MVKVMKRLNKWVEAISLVIMGLLMCYGSWGKEGVLPIGEFTQVCLVFCTGAGVFWYRTRQEKRLRKDVAESR